MPLGLLADLKDFKKKASGSVWRRQEQSSLSALHMARTHSIRVIRQISGDTGNIRKLPS